MSTMASTSTLLIQSGSLGVVERLHIGPVGDAFLQQLGGSLSAEELVVGSQGLRGLHDRRRHPRYRKDDPWYERRESGTFSLTAGTPTCTIAESLLVARGGSFVCGAGTLNVGTSSTDGMLLDGVFTLINLPTVSMRGLRMTGLATLSITVGPLGISMINAANTAVIDGLLLVTDVLAANGTYEVLRGNPLQGTFDTAILPPDWTWRVEGNSLLLTKGPAPVESSSLGPDQSDVLRSGTSGRSVRLCNNGV